jgi:hypothetical protein
MDFSRVKDWIQRLYRQSIQSTRVTLPSGLLVVERVGCVVEDVIVGGDVLLVVVVAGGGKAGDAGEVGNGPLAVAPGVELVGREFAVDLAAVAGAIVVLTGFVHDFLLDLAH